MLEIMNPSKLQHITHSDSYNFLFQIAVTLDLVTSLRASHLTPSLQLLQRAVQWPPSMVSFTTSARLIAVHNLVNHSLCVLALLIKALSQVTGKTIFINLAVHLQKVCVSLFSSKGSHPTPSASCLLQPLTKRSLLTISPLSPQNTGLALF